MKEHLEYGEDRGKVLLQQLFSIQRSNSAPNDIPWVTQHRHRTAAVASPWKTSCEPAPASSSHPHIKNQTVPWPVWLSWLVRHPINQKVVGSIPGQGACLGCGFSPWWGHVQEATNGCFSHQCLSPSHPPSLSLSLQSISMPSGED